MRRSIPRTILAATAMLVAALGPARGAAAATPPCPAPPTTEVHVIASWLHTCGTGTDSYIADYKGRVVRPITVSLWPMSHDQGRTPGKCLHWQAPPDSTYTNLQSWGFNAVLLYISWANVEPTPPTYRTTGYVHHYDQAYLTAADLHLADFEERVGNRIHKADPHLLLFTPDRLSWKTGKYALTRKPNLPNAVYMFEFFAPDWDTTGQPRMATYLSRASSWNR